MYPEYMNESLEKVARTRGERFELARTGKPVYPLMDAQERKDVLDGFHPDFQKGAQRKVRVGPNKGEMLTTEVAEMLESHSRISAKLFDLSKPDFETELLIVGGGGAGAAAPRGPGRGGGWGATVPGSPCGWRPLLCPRRKNPRSSGPLRAVGLGSDHFSLG